MLFVAETRPRLGEGMTLGHDGKKFFPAGDHGVFRMRRVADD